jgi:choline dehydrogenase
MNTSEFDYVVVGGGSAGCVVASRLSEDPAVSVCLLEAGGADKSIFIHAPAGVVAMLPIPFNNWAFKTVPQHGLNGRLGYQPRGKVLGGSSSTNAMLYVRGHRWDYDHWAGLGNPGWSYASVLPYFKRAENNETHGASEFHGAGGPLNVAELRSPSALNQAFLAAAAMNGIQALLKYFALGSPLAQRKSPTEWSGSDRRSQNHKRLSGPAAVVRIIVFYAPFV